MHSAIRANNVADLAHLQPVRRLLEGLLHLAVAEPPQIPAFLVRGTVRVLLRQLGELVSRRPNLRLITSQDLDRLLLRTGNLVLSEGLQYELGYGLQEATTRTSFQLDGRLLPLCLTRRWLARTWPERIDSWAALTRAVACSSVSSGGAVQLDTFVTVLKKYGAPRDVEMRTSH
jgi:hypothetical protein